MKKRLFKSIVLFIIVSLFSSLTVFASNGQKLYDSFSYEYRMTKLLCSVAGVLGPTPVSPLTSNELIMALDRIEKDDLNLTARNLYSDLYGKLNEAQESTFKYEGDIVIAPQVFISNNYKGKGADGYGRAGFFLDYKDELPFIDFQNEIGFSDNAFFEVDLGFKNFPTDDGLRLTSFNWICDFTSKPISFIAANGTVLFEPHIPIVARGSFGNDWFNFLIGRSRQAFGNGITGNLIIGDNFSYQELMKTAFFSNYFTYNLSITHFDEQLRNYEDEKNEELFNRTMFGGKHVTRVVHRADFNIFNKVGLAINLGTLYYSDSAFDFRWLTPFMIAHNYFNYDEASVNRPAYDEANNIMGLELNWAIAPSWNLGLQLAVDQFALAIEAKGRVPNGIAASINLAKTDLFEDYSLRSWIEGVYSSPYMYLNSKKDESGDPDYNYDFILGYFRDSWMSQNVSYSGYYYGPDCIVISTGVDYYNYKLRMGVEGSLQYMAHGVKGISNPTFEGDAAALLPTGTVEHTLALRCTYNYDILPDTLNIFTGAYIAYAANFNNQEDEARFTPQGYFGIRWSVL